MSETLETVVVVCKALVCMVIAIVIGVVAYELKDATLLWWMLLPSFLYILI